MNSRIPGFYGESHADRRETVAERCGLSAVAADALRGDADVDRAARLSENVVGTLSVPLGVATNFVVDGRDVLVPMATEESSVVAAASHGALMARPTGGFVTSVSDPRMVAQVQIVDVADPHAARARVEAAADLRALASEGIQAGHMKLHARNVAVQAGAPEDLVDEVAARMVAEDDVREGRARELLADLS